MSFRGLFRNGSGILNKIEILDVFRARIKGKRGFAKPTSKKLGMDIDYFDHKGSTIMTNLDQSYVEGLVIKIKQKDFPEFCNREGYIKGNELISFSSKSKNIGYALWNLFLSSKQENSIQSIKKYRKNLFKKICYTSRHYIPHPLKLKNLGNALTFVAPGRYGTGDEHLTSRKSQKGISKLLNAHDALKRNDVNREKFLEYTLECIYGGVHGVNVNDIIELISTDQEFLDDLRIYLTKEKLNEEREKFINQVIGNSEKYKQNFGEFNQNLERSGLDLILKE